MAAAQGRVAGYLTRRQRRWPLMMVLLLVSPLAGAITLTSSAAGFAGVPGQYCNGDSNNFEIEILHNTFSCQRHGIVEFDVSSSGTAPVSSAVMSLYDGRAGRDRRSAAGAMDEKEGGKIILNRS